MTAAKFKPLVFPVLGFALSNKANILIIMIFIGHFIGQGEAQHRKYKRLKLGGGHVYDRSSV
jgi:hypothetical protein